MRRSNLTEKVFGRLTAKHIIEAKETGKHCIWFCVCSCGGSNKVSVNNLISGSVKSCGCLKREIASRVVKVTNAKQKGKKREKVSKPGTAFRALLRAYRRGAIERGLSFNLSDELFLQLTSGECYYCGAPPNPAFRKKSQFGEIYIYNGIDRRDNLLGYEPTNCSSCCNRCNMAKKAMNEETFLSFISAVYNHSIAGRTK